MSKKIIFCFSLSILSPALAFATGAPMLGNAKAFSHQLCGKNITLQISNTTDGHTVLGLKNKKTGELDLFVSPNPFDITDSYSQFKPVKFDGLSKELIETNENDIDIVWGASQDVNQKTHYTLALGNYTYDCTSIVAWPDDKANDLYGEPSADAMTDKNNESKAKKTASIVQPGASVKTKEKS